MRINRQSDKVVKVEVYHTFERFLNAHHGLNLSLVSYIAKLRVTDLTRFNRFEHSSIDPPKFQSVYIAPRGNDHMS